MEGRRPTEQEFGELIRRFAPGIAALLRRTSPSFDLRGDALQEALARAWAARASYDPARPFGPWLATIALRTARDLARARARRPDRTTLEEEEHGEPVDRDERPDETAARRDEGARLAADLSAALAALPAVAREVFLRFHRDEASLQEIADGMGVPLNTVKSHLHRARRRLAERLRGPS
jgi:RNA polymerase sigma factor (sigma-70 family)